MNAFWLLIQHQDFDLDLQKACLKKCDFNKKDKAYLTDRILVSQGKKQKYGTQFYKNKKGNLVPRPIKALDQLDKRRKNVGLESFSRYKKKIKKVNSF